MIHGPPQKKKIKEIKNSIYVENIWELLSTKTFGGRGNKW